MCKRGSAHTDFGSWNTPERWFADRPQDERIKKKESQRANRIFLSIYYNEKVDWKEQDWENDLSVESWRFCWNLPRIKENPIWNFNGIWRSLKNMHQDLIHEKIMEIRPSMETSYHRYSEGYGFSRAKPARRAVWHPRGSWWWVPMSEPTSKSIVLF